MCQFLVLAGNRQSGKFYYDRKIKVLVVCLAGCAVVSVFGSGDYDRKKKSSSRPSGGLCCSPPPKNVERNILGYVDRLKFCSLFLLIAQFNNNKPHNTSTTHNNNQNEPPLPYPWRLCPLIPWACQRRPQRMVPRLPMAPRKVPVIGFGRPMVGSLVGVGKMKTQQKIEREWWFGLRWPKLHGKTQQPAKSRRSR